MKHNIKKLGILFVCFTAILLGCSKKSHILPYTNIKYIGKYHCWPYNVKVYSVDRIEVDSLFYTYPLKEYFWISEEYNVSTWQKYDDLDSLIWPGMNKELEQCDDNIELYKHIISGEEVYYSGSYRYMINREGNKKRSYEKILFLDLKANKLHIFKDINKLY